MENTQNWMPTLLSCNLISTTGRRSNWPQGKNTLITLMRIPNNHNNIKNNNIRSVNKCISQHTNADCNASTQMVELKTKNMARNLWYRTEIRTLLKIRKVKSLVVSNSKIKFAGVYNFFEAELTFCMELQLPHSHRTDNKSTWLLSTKLWIWMHIRMFFKYLSYTSNSFRVCPSHTVAVQH